MSENNLRRQMIETHGPTLGPVLFEAEFARRTRINDRAHTLNAELTKLRAEYDVQSAQLAQNLPPLQAAMEAAYEKWLAACNAHEGQRVRNDAALSPLTNRIAELRTQINTPAFAEGLTQWGVPDWFKPTPPEFPMPRSTKG
jgi:hypothetical protein